MHTLVRAFSALNLALGKLVAPISLVITALVLMEVLARYFFNAPTTWSNEVDQYLLCALVMLGGGYTLRNMAHTRVDIIYIRFTDRNIAWIEVLTAVLVMIFTLPMIYYGGKLAIEAMISGQTSVSAARLPLWPSMATVPLGAIFLLLQALANGMKGVHYLKTGQPMEAS